MKSIDEGFIKSIFKEALELNENSYSLSLDSQFGDVPGWDSLGHMKIVTAIEETLDVEFDIEEIIGVDTIEKLIKMVVDKLKE